MSEIYSHYQALVKHAYDKEILYNGDLTIEVIPSLMRRQDGSNVFEEGNAFSGAVCRGTAEAYITAAASPHTAPSVPRESLLTAAHTVLGKEVQLPDEMEKAELISPQLVIWWRDKKRRIDDRADLLYIATLSPEEQADFCQTIAMQTARAVEIITIMTMAQQPTIWGSWGFATQGERIVTGRGRGVPTNKHGHLHVIDFGYESAKVHRESQPTAAEKLNHYEPWGTMLHETFSIPLARSIEMSVNQNYAADVVPFSENVMAPDDCTLGTINHGYVITFDSPQRYANVFNTLIRLGGTFEALYKNITDAHSRYYKHHSQSKILETTQATIISEAISVGFNDDEADALASFALRIRPTYSQICTWLENIDSNETYAKDDIDRLTKKKNQYERVGRYLAQRAANDSLIAGLIKGTVANPGEHTPQGSVWPEHASITFVIDDYEQDDQKRIFVKSFKLIPGIDSTESAPEHKTGRTLKRSIAL